MAQAYLKHHKESLINPWIPRRNLRNCPIDSRRTAYIALVRPTLEYGASVWDPYQKQDIHRLERIQHQAARFITRDYHSREQGCVTKMLSAHNLPSLESRRKEMRLGMLFKVVNGLLPALKPSDFLTPARPRRQVRRPGHLRDFVAETAATDRVSCHHSNCFMVPSSRTDQFRHSFFVETVLNWNHLDECVAGSGSAGDFRSKLSIALV